MGLKKTIWALTFGRDRYLIELLLLGGFSIFIGVKIIIYWFEGGHNYMLIPGILVIILGVAIILGFSYDFWKKNKRHQNTLSH